MGQLLLCRVLPTWVEADPLRGRAIDALGLQLTADKIADELLPGISVLTVRARYYSVLAWARRACGPKVDEERIHKLEVALALREAILHADNEDSCRFVGSRNLRNYRGQLPPSDPRVAYQTPVWRSYRASMRSLGFLNLNDDLTDEGDALARQFSRACSPKDKSGTKMLPQGACLSVMSADEGASIENGLGIWKKGKLLKGGTSPQSRRAVTELEVRSMLQTSPSAILECYEKKKGSTSNTAVIALRQAAVWERLSVGLQALFLLSLHNLEHPGHVKTAILIARKAKSLKRLSLSSIEVDDFTADNAIQSIRRSLKLREQLVKEGICSFDDHEAFDLGERAVSGCEPVESLICALEMRHHQAKLDDAWIRHDGKRKELVRESGDSWTLPTRANVRSYRLLAFSRLLNDLRKARG